MNRLVEEVYSEQTQDNQSPVTVIEGDRGNWTNHYCNEEISLRDRDDYTPH